MRNFNLHINLLFIVAIIFTGNQIANASTASSKEIKYNNIRFRQPLVANRLPNNTVQTITQDSYGYMWFGTNSGLCRYDGYELTIFKHDDNDRTSLRNDIVNKLYSEPNSNRIWISTDGGICCYYHERDRFSNHVIKDNKRRDIKFTTTVDGRLLVNSSVGVYMYDVEEDCLKPYILCNDNNTKSVDRVECDRWNRLWIKCANRLLYYDRNTERFIDLPHALRKLANDCRKLILTPTNQLIIRSSDKIWGYDIAYDKIYEVKFSNKSITHFNCVEVDNSNNLWFGTEDGIYILNNKYEELSHLEHDTKDLCNLNNTTIYSIFNDNSNNIWVGTLFGGINLHVAGSDSFHTYPSGLTSNHLNGRIISSIVNSPDGGQYIASEDGGINHISADGKITRDEILSKKIGINSGRNIRCLYITQERYLWIGFSRQGIIRYDIQTGNMVDYNKLTPDTSAFSIQEDKNGNIWYGGPMGLFVIRGGSDKSEPQKVSSATVLSMLPIDDTRFLIATRRSSLRILDTERSIVTTHNILPKKSLHTTHIYRDSHGLIWVGANNNMLYVLDEKIELVTYFSEEELGSSDIKSIIEDNQNNIWVGCGNGLRRIEKQSRHVTHYSCANGLPTDQFYHTASCKQPDGKLLFGTINGMVSFYPYDLNQDEPKFNVTLTGVWSNAQKVSPNSPNSPTLEPIPSLKQMTLKHADAQSLNIQYSALNYQYADNTLYSIKMEGVNDNWEYVGNQYQIRFSNLAAGNYRLHVKASGYGDMWDEEGALTLDIDVLPPWWLSTWAYICYILICLVVIFISIFYTKARLTLIMRLKSEQEQRANNEQLNKQKISFFSYVSHDLKTPLTLIVTPLKQIIERYEESKASKEMATNDVNMDQLKVVYRNANRMNYLIDELLKFSKIEMHQMQMNLRRGDIMLFLGELSQIFSFVASEREIEFAVSLDTRQKDVWFSPSKLERIIYNLLSNAFKYTPDGGSVVLKATLEEHDGMTMAIISVKDSGRGIAKELQSKIFDSYYQVEKRDQRTGFGLGLSLTRSLIQLHKGQIEVISEPGKGAEFIATINVSSTGFDKSEYSMESITTNEIESINRRLEETISLIPDQITDQGKESDNNTILIVEDSRDMNEYIASIFADEYDIMCAYNGKQAIKLMENRLPDIIISDVMMPEMDGLELTQNVKNNINTSHIPVILITAKDSISDQTDGYEVGADAYITKPFNAKNLKLLIANIENNRARIIERFKRSKSINHSLLATNTADSQFMQELINIIMENLSNEEFGVSEVLSQMKISRTLLHTKIKALSGTSFIHFLRSIKMREAKSLLQQGHSVADVSTMVGIPDPSYLTKCFKKEFEMTPTEFIKSCNDN